MATFDAALYYELANSSSGITDITSTRIYPIAEVPQGTEVSDGEYLTFQRLSATRHPHQGAAAGLVTARFQFNCYAVTQADAFLLAAAVVAKFASYRDATMGESGDSVVLRKSFVLDNADRSTPPTAGGQRGPIWQSVDVMFDYVE